MRKVPVLSLNEYINGNKAQQAQFSKALYSAFKEYGFVVIENHTVKSELLDLAYNLSKQLFDLPVDAKQKYQIVNGGGQRGYTSFGKEHAKGSSVTDLKEFWHVGRELPNPGSGALRQNVWPSEISEFKDVFISIYKELDHAGSVILEALAPMLGLEKDYLSSRSAGGDSVLRLLHYPPITKGMDPKAVRAGQHTDINLITLLVSGTTSGLELLDKNGKWLPVESNPNTIVVNIGDMLSRITNDTLPSTVHRVVNPENNNISRYSMPFFIHPRSEVILSSLKSCEENGVIYPDISAGDFLTQRLREIGLIK